MNVAERVNVEPHAFTHVRVVAIPSFKSEKDVIQEVIKSELNITSHRSDRNKFRAMMRVRFNPEANDKHPYSIDVGCITQIEVIKTDGKLLESEKRKIVARAAHDLLLPAIRELILCITSRQPWGQMSIGLSDLDIDGITASNAQETEKEPLAKKKTIRRKKSAPSLLIP